MSNWIEDKHPTSSYSSSISVSTQSQEQAMNSSLSKRKRNIFLSIPLGLILLFCVIFFPIYFTQHHSSFSTTIAGVGNATASSVKAKTTPGAVWCQSSNFKDLNELRIEYYSSGQNNSKILTNGLPRNVWNDQPPHRRRRRRREADEKEKIEEEKIVNPRPNRALGRQDLPSTTTTSRPQPTSTPSGSVFQIFYPANSYTPSTLPVGGTQFYALTPFDLSVATSVTFNYSVFFPLYYDFVLGGKLPGLYGGTEGCGGGNKAIDCWSSRMAWRSEGAGELYAYLPQEKQNITALLEVKPYSFVNGDYGM